MLRFPLSGRFSNVPSMTPEPTPSVAAPVLDHELLAVFAWAADAQDWRLLRATGHAHGLMGCGLDALPATGAQWRARLHPDDADLAPRLFAPWVAEAAPLSRTDVLNLRLVHEADRVCCVRAVVERMPTAPTDPDNPPDADTPASPRLVLRLQDPKALATGPSAALLATQFTAMLENIGDYLYFKDRHHVFTGASQSLTRLTRGGAQHWTDLVGQTDYDVFPRAYADAYYRLEKAIFSGKVSVAHDVQPTLDAAGRRGWVDNRKYPIHDAQGQVVGLFGIARDITAQKKAEDELLLAATVYQAIGSAIMVVDAQRRIVNINPAFTELTGYSASDVLGQTPALLRSGENDPNDDHLMWQALDASGHWQGEVRNRHKDGRVVRLWLVINTLFGPSGEVRQRICMYSRITDQKLAEQTIWQQANFDQLTLLPNRRMFRDRLAQEMKKTDRSGRPLAVLFLDVDHFKEVNDTLGHPTGDLLLKEAAQRLSACVRKADTVARLGGDEFTLILGDLDAVANVDKVAQNILSALAQPFQMGLETLHLTGSIGITLYPTDGADIDTLLKNADQALYAAKKQGRARYSYFTPHMQEAALNRMRLANDLRSAVSGQQLSLHYQPIVDLRTGRVTKAEALLRWHHPTRGLVSPADFIPVAEQTGLILAIGDWVFREAARQAAAWHQRLAEGIQISVNTSAAQYRKHGISQGDWFDYLHSLGLPRSHIVIEITESMMMEEAHDVTAKLSGLRDGGLQVSLDDFGTGYSSLSYIKKFNIDYLKIDRSFIRNLQPDSDDLALCEAIIVMAHKLGMAVIAEGIETAEQAALIREAGCDYAQGYHFSKPVPADAFEQYLARVALQAESGG